MEEGREIIQELEKQTEGGGQREKPKDEQFHFDCKAGKKKEVNPFHSHPPHHPSYVVCGSGKGWAGLDTCKMNKAIISFDTSL